MATLHILSHSPFADSRLASCLRLLSADDGLLLTGDATYALQPGTANLQALQLMPATIALHALMKTLPRAACKRPSGYRCWTIRRSSSCALATTGSTAGYEYAQRRRT